MHALRFALVRRGDLEERRDGITLLVAFALKKIRIAYRDTP